jgi:hypothetical protein
VTGRFGYSGADRAPEAMTAHGNGVQPRRDRPGGVAFFFFVQNGYPGFFVQDGYLRAASASALRPVVKAAGREPARTGGFAARCAGARR